MLRTKSWAVLPALLLLCLTPALRAEGEKSEKTYEVEIKKGVAYYEGKDANETRHKLDLYLPKGAKDYPVFFFIHGGGWTRGSKDGFGRHGNLFAKNGIGFVAINYRLDASHPAHIQDVARAFAWVHANLGKQGANLKEVFVSGHSAGGHLAALLVSDESYLKEHKLGAADIKGVVPVSGVFRISERMGKLFGDADSCKKASPLTHVRGNLPPMLILYGEREIAGLGKQAEEYATALKKAKAEAEVAMIADRDHGSIMGKIANADDPATTKIFAFIRKQTAK